MSSSVAASVGTPVASRPYPQQQQQRQQPPPLQQGGMAGPPMMDVYSQLGNLYPLRSQIEFYFSPQNLAKDTFLLSQLNMSDHIGAVPMRVICSFPKVRQIHAFLHNMGHLPPHMTPMADPFIVLMSLKQSSVVTVSQDGAWISPRDSSWAAQSQQSNSSSTTSPSDHIASGEPRTVTSTPSSPSSQATASSSLGVPTHPLPPAAATGTTASSTTSTASMTSSRTERNIVIVRDLPSTVTPEEVLQAFQTDSVTPNAARPDVGNTWFVTFETEEQALMSLSATRDSTIGGVPVQARLKSDVRPPPPPQSQQQIQPKAVSSSSSDSVGNASVDGSINLNFANIRATGGMPPLQPMPMMYPVMSPPGYPMPMQQQQHMQQYGYVASYPMMPPPQAAAAGGHHMAMRGPPHQQPYHPYAYAANQGYLPLGNYPPRPGGNLPPPNNVYLRGERSHQTQSGTFSSNSNNSNQANNRNNLGKNVVIDNPISNNNIGNGNQSNNNNGKKNKKGQNNNKNKNNNYNGKQQLQQQQQQPTDQISETGDGEKKGKKQNSQQRQQKRTNTTKNTKQKQQDTSTSIDLGAEHFPALGGGNVSTTNSNQNKDKNDKALDRPPVSGGYAQALLKKSGPAAANSGSNNVPSATAPAEVPITTLDAAMSQLAFSAGDATKAAYDDW
mmetsp:Transcript_71021/g.199240  ORF Transcript_71021/g.199240 Transcript_71021/m.199240 type:complete len:670 (-) Transcript_71021:333-2342(-)